MSTLQCHLLSWRLDVEAKRAWVRSKVVTDGAGACSVSILENVHLADNVPQGNVLVSEAWLDVEEEFIFLILDCGRVVIAKGQTPEDLLVFLKSLGAHAPDHAREQELVQEFKDWQNTSESLDMARSEPGNILSLCPLAAPGTQFQGRLTILPSGHEDHAPVQGYFAISSNHLFRFIRDPNGTPEEALPLSQVTITVDSGLVERGTYVWTVSSPIRTWRLRAKHGTSMQQWLKFLVDNGAQGNHALAELRSAQQEALNRICELEDIENHHEASAVFKQYIQDEGVEEELELFKQFSAVLKTPPSDDSDVNESDNLAEACSQPEAPGFLPLFNNHYEEWQSLIDQGNSQEVLQQAAELLREHVETKIVPHFFHSRVFMNLKDTIEGNSKKRGEVIFGDKALFIQSTSGKGKKISYQVPLEYGSFMLGRDESCDIVLAGPKVSRYHCSLLVGQDDVIQIFDLGTRGGVLLNGHRVEVAGLKLSDKVQIGKFELRFGLQI